MIYRRLALCRIRGGGEQLLTNLTILPSHRVGRIYIPTGDHLLSSVHCESLTSLGLTSTGINVNSRQGIRLYLCPSGCVCRLGREGGTGAG